MAMSNSPSSIRRSAGSLALTVLAIAAVVSCESSTEAKVAYGASLTGAKVKPTAVTSGGSGTFTATVSGGSAMRYDLTFQGLSSGATSATIRGPASDTGTAEVLIDLNQIPLSLGSGTITLGATSGAAQGNIDLTRNVSAGFSGDSLRKLMDAGLLYVEIATSVNPGAEIRGQITKQ
jgi:CHRD domain